MYLWIDKTGMEAISTGLNSDGMHIHFVTSDRPRSGLEKFKSSYLCRWVLYGVPYANGFPVGEKRSLNNRYRPGWIVCCQFVGKLNVNFNFSVKLLV